MTRVDLCKYIAGFGSVFINVNQGHWVAPSTGQTQVGRLPPINRSLGDVGSREMTKRWLHNHKNDNKERTTTNKQSTNWATRRERAKPKRGGKEQVAFRSLLPLSAAVTQYGNSVIVTTRSGEMLANSLYPWWTWVRPDGYVTMGTSRRRHTV